MSRFNILHYVKVILLLTAFMFLLSLPLLIIFTTAGQIYPNSSLKFVILLAADLATIYFLMPTYKASYHFTLNLAKKSIPRVELTALSLLVFIIYMATIAKLLVQFINSPLPDAIFSASILIYLILGFAYAEPSTTVLDKIEKIVR